MPPLPKQLRSTQSLPPTPLLAAPCLPKLLRPTQSPHEKEKQCLPPNPLWPTSSQLQE
jgi:hypothetical protein